MAQAVANHRSSAQSVVENATALDSVGGGTYIGGLYRVCACVFRGYVYGGCICGIKGYNMGIGLVILLCVSLLLSD